MCANPLWLRWEWICKVHLSPLYSFRCNDDAQQSGSENSKTKQKQQQPLRAIFALPNLCIPALLFLNSVFVHDGCSLFYLLGLRSALEQNLTRKSVSSANAILGKRNF